MKSIKIKFPDEMSEQDALLYLQATIRKGRISKNNTSFCYATQFANGVVIQADRIKDVDVFTISKNEPGALT